jgi:hypothetical protein
MLFEIGSGNGWGWYLGVCGLCGCTSWWDLEWIGVSEFRFVQADWWLFMHSESI